MKILRFLLALEAMRRAWRKFHPVRILKFFGVVLLGIAALAIVAALLKKLGEKQAEPLPAPRALPAKSEPDESGACPASHPVKGISRSGIYHAPESRWYGRSKADVCFSDAAAAERAGFRAPGTPK